jgi:hypothetical protein
MAEPVAHAPVFEVQEPPAWLRSPWFLLAEAIAFGFVLAILWSLSVPGIDFFLFVISGIGIVFALAVWLVRAVVHLVADGPAWRLLVTPAIVVIGAGIAVTGAPLEARFALSRDAFDDYVRDHVAPSNGVRAGSGTLPDPGRLGWYDITSVRQVDDAVLFSESTGAFFDNAGFAYLPSGPSPSLSNGGFESPRWEHLTGDWYAWTASW